MSQKYAKNTAYLSHKLPLHIRSFAWLKQRERFHVAVKLTSKEFYTAAQTKELLGITDGMLYNYVDNGALERIFPPGKKQGVYRCSQGDQLARELKGLIATK